MGVRLISTVPVALVLTILVWSRLAQAGDVTFRVHDRVPEAEIEEVTTVYIDGTLAGSFHLGPDEPEIVLNVTVPDAMTHVYALCGHVDVHESNGRVRRQAFDVSGLLFDVNGRDFEAVAGDDFHEFSLADVTAGPPPVRPPVRIEAEKACVPATS